MTRKRDHIKRVFKDLYHPPKASVSESASKTSGTVLGALEPQLSETTARKNEPSVAGSLSQDTSVEGLWGLALEKLSSEDKVTISRIKSDSKLEILRHVHAAAVKKRTDCEDKRWKFELNGRQIILRDVADKIIVWIDKFKQIGDIAVSFDPVHAALPWAGIRFLLEVGLT